MHLFQTHQLTIGYAQEKILAQNLNLSIQSGEIIAFIGANGIGKSTLIKTLNGQIAPLKGNITINGEDIANKRLQERALLIATVQNHTPQTHFSVRESIALGRHPYTNWLGHLTEEDQQLITNIIETLQLQDLQEKCVTELSDGEKQRVNIARAWAQETPFLMLDEPTSHLDYPARIELMRLLAQLAHEKQKAVLLSTHEIQLALQYCDKIWLFDPQKNISTLPPHEVTAEKLNFAFSTDVF